MLYFTIYFIAAIIIYCIVARKLRKEAESENIENPEAEPIKPFLDHKNGIHQGIKGILAFFLIIVGFFVFFMDVFVYDYWLFFGDKRTSEIENKYGIIVDNDIKLKKYMLCFGGPDGAISRLELECDIDCKSFFEKNCRGELIYYTENGMVYYADGTKEEYESSESEDILCYRSKRTHSAIFQKDGDKFYVTFR